MKLHIKRNILSFVIFPLGVFIIGIVATLSYDAIVVLAFPYVVIVEYFSRKIICPNCAKPLGWHKYKVFGYAFMWWSPFSPNKCEKCGHDFRKEFDH